MVVPREGFKKIFILNTKNVIQEIYGRDAILLWIKVSLWIVLRFQSKIGVERNITREINATL